MLFILIERTPVYIHHFGDLCQFMPQQDMPEFFKERYTLPYSLMLFIADNNPCIILFIQRHTHCRPSGGARPFSKVSPKLVGNAINLLNGQNCYIINNYLQRLKALLVIKPKLLTK